MAWGARAPWGRRLLAATLLCLGLARARAQDTAPKLAFAEGWAGLFGGKAATFHVRVLPPTAFTGRLGWAFSVESRSLARQEQAVSATPDQAAVVEIKIAVPPVKPGVVMPARLTVHLFGPAGEPLGPGLEKRLWVFPENPFADRVEWLRHLDVRVFDPVGKTEAVFRQAEIPFTAVRNVDGLAESAKAGWLILGAGLSFADYRGLVPALTQLADNGWQVLCLAPGGGEFDLPGSADADLPRPTALEFRKTDIIAELDKRLDATAWPPDGTLPTGSTRLTASRTQVRGDVQPTGTDWPWFSAEFASGGHLVLCGFAIVERWDAGPTPRFLLARILERLAKESADGAGQKRSGD